MRKWIALILILPTLWAGYWLFGSYGLKNEVRNWLAERQNDGWQAEYTDLSVRGFPNRFDLTLSDIQLTDPDTGISWSAPFFQLLSLSYQPQHQIAVWPNTQTLATPFQKIVLSSQDMKASVVTVPKTTLEVSRSTLIANDIKLASSSGWDAEIRKISASIRQLSEPQAYELSTEIDTLVPSEKLRNWFDQGQNLPATIENISLNLTAVLSDSISLRTIEDERPQIRELQISRVRANWGELVLRGTGTLMVNGQGVMDGEIKLSAKNWREMLQMAQVAGTISDDVARAAELGLGLIARLNGSETSLDTTLTFRSGRMFLGPIPIGAAPKLIIR